MFYTYKYRSGFIHETDGKPVRVQREGEVIPCKSTSGAKRIIRALESGARVVRLTPMRREVGTGKPGYRWAPGYLVENLYPPVSLPEAYELARTLADSVIVVRA